MAAGKQRGSVSGCGFGWQDERSVVWEAVKGASAAVSQGSREPLVRLRQGQAQWGLVSAVRRSLSPDNCLKGGFQTVLWCSLLSGWWVCERDSLLTVFGPHRDITPRRVQLAPSQPCVLSPARKIALLQLKGLGWNLHGQRFVLS